MEKAYIFTLDVVIAAAVLTTLMTSMYFMLGNMKPTTPNTAYLAATDSLTTLDLSGDLKRSIRDSNGSNLKEYLDNAMQQQFCGRITVRNQSNSTIINTTKSNCTVQNESLTVARRMLMVKGDPYRVKMEVGGA